MNKKSLLFVAGLLLSFGAKAQMSDVTEQYISNADFEACEALPTVIYHDVQKDIDINKVELYQESSVAKGYDYEAQGWKLVEQQTAVNGGVITYGCNVQTGKWATAGEPGAQQGVTGSKGLCFVGNKGLVYQQANEITLPAGIYRLTVNLYARNGQTTNPGPTQQVVNIKTGFMPTGGTEDDLIPAIRKSTQYASNAWDQEVIDIELAKPTTGRFQISYGTSYFVVVDDVKLEYQGGVVTTALANVVKKATALNAELESSDLTNAIAAAQAFIANPTDQDAVAGQVETLYAAMSNALAATTKTVNITAAYLDNPSFETGKLDPWQGGGSVGEPINSLSTSYINGKNTLEFTQAGSNNISQIVDHLPAGYYMVDAKLSMNAQLVLGSSKTSCTGGAKDTPLYLRVHSSVQNFTSGELKVGASGSLAYRIDDFRLFYAKDEASLLALALNDVKNDAEALLADQQFAKVLGEERTELIAAIDGSDDVAINTKANLFCKAKDAYDRFASKVTVAAQYQLEAYPYASADIFSQIQTIITSVPTSAADAQMLTANLEKACFDFYVSNGYCEGVACEDMTSKILSANAAEGATGWGVKNMTLRNDKTGWLNPKTGETDNVVFGVTTDYYRACANEASILKQTLSGLSAGKYVISMTMMGSKNLPVLVFFNSEKIGQMTGTGTSDGKYGAGWNDFTIEFNKADDTDMPLQLQCKPTANYQEWFVDNFRLYKLTEDANGINIIENVKLNAENGVYDMQGRRVSGSQLKKGLYIQNGKKILKK